MKVRLTHTVIFIILVTVIIFAGFFPMLKWFFPIKYGDIVSYHARRHDLDPLLVTAVMRVESEFNPHAVSHKGARGLMQIMPETGKWVAEQIGMDSFEIDRLFDPEVNVEIGVWYLASLKRQFSGNDVLALAAYNGGRGNVARWLGENIWTGQFEHSDDIPFPETRVYVRKVMTTYEWYQFVWGATLN